MLATAIQNKKKVTNHAADQQSQNTTPDKTPKTNFAVTTAPHNTDQEDTNKTENLRDITETEKDQGDTAQGETNQGETEQQLTTRKETEMEDAQGIQKIYPKAGTTLHITETRMKEREAQETKVPE